MADQAQDAGASDNIVTPAAPVVQVPDKPRVQASELPPEALKARLEAAEASGQRKLLESLGIKEAAELKTLIDEKHKRDEAAKSLEQRAAEQATALEAERARGAALIATIKARADVEIAALTDAQRAAVAAIAGDDASKQLAAIDALKPTWGSQSAPAVQAPSAPAAQSTTTPRASAPAEAGTVAMADARATFERLKVENPFAAAQFARRHAGSLFAGNK